MGRLAVDIAIVLGTFFFMEGVAWFTHKYIMHGLCWFLHEDHHHKEHAGFLERNDFFFLIFAIPGITCLAIGNVYHVLLCALIGSGITLYGACYFLVHDIFIHQRFRIFRRSGFQYLNALRRAHKVHHKHLGKEDGECFGMLWVPLKYFRQNYK